MVFKEFIRFLDLDNDQFVYFIFRGNIFYWVYYFQLWLQYSFKSITSFRIVVRCRVVIFFINKFFTFSLLLLWIDIFDILGRNTWQNEIMFFISHQNWYNMTIIIKIPFPCARFERDSAVPNTTNCPVFLKTFVTKVIYPSWFIIQIFKPVNWSGGTLAYSKLYKL